MKKGMILLCLAVLSACGHKVETSDIAKLNGYWEIEFVKLGNGEQKDYKMNDTYDYFAIKGNQGTRTKVMPQLDGTFLTNGVSEQVQIVTKKEQTFIEYSTRYAKWCEQLLTVNETELVLLNLQKNECHYKKAAAINLNQDGKKAQ